MKLKWLVLFVALAASGVTVSNPADNQEGQDKKAQTQLPASRVGSVPLQDRAPAFSSPQERMDENGDRVGHYPPYYHPEPSGGTH